jgi:membrane fusion protein (multidrug efflux system)
MKNISYVLVLSVLIASCGDSGGKSVDDYIAEGNLETLRSKKNEISETYKILGMEIKQLDSAIAVQTGEGNLPLISTITAKVEKFNHFLELQGDVATKQNVLIYPEMQGTLQRVLVKSGQSVSKGQLLATIDDGGMGSQLAQLETQTTLAKTTFERQERLWNQKIGSEIQYLQAKTNFEAAESSVKQIRSQLGRSSIRAPFSGIIDDVIKDQGTVVAPGPGSEVFRIINLSDMYIEVDVPESYLSDIKKGNLAKVYFPVLGDTIISEIRQTSNFINPGNRAFTVEVAVPNINDAIKPNLTAKVSLNDYSADAAILVPQGIISENADGQQYLYVANDKEDNKATAKRRIITTGRTQGNMVEVLSGITEGDLLIKEGARSVKDGQNVQVLSSK